QLLKKTEFGDDGSELVTEYQRDSAGRLLVKTLADGTAIHYRYDALGRLVSVDDGHWPLAPPVPWLESSTLPGAGKHHRRPGTPPRSALSLHRLP
ncbi:RHS repeat protein, partial [Pseudomonas syringae pv. syringae]